MEDIFVILVIGLVLSGLWIMVREIRRTEKNSWSHHSGPDYWHLGGDEGCRSGCDRICSSESGHWDWLELLDYVG